MSKAGLYLLHQSPCITDEGYFTKTSKLSDCSLCKCIQNVTHYATISTRMQVGELHAYSYYR